MRIKTEKDVLDPKVRKQVIDEIVAREEQDRRDRAYKKQQCYRDQTRRFVIDTLLQQFEQTTVNQMSYAISNISLVKKIIDKLARVYSYGVDRTIEGSVEQTDELQELAKVLEVDTNMKLVNRFLKLHRNTLLYIKPCPYEKQGEMYTGLKLQPMSPHLYSVIEDFYDRTRPMGIVLSNYEQNRKYRVSLEPSKEGRTYNSPQTGPVGDQTDQIIADTPEDANAHLDPARKKYIWWTDSYHFTTNGHGEMLDPETQMVMATLSLDKIANPIEELPFADFAIDQDGAYWAYGGDDLIDGAILINCLISNLNHIAVTQGYGQMVMTGKNLPNNVLVGPDKVIKLEYQKDEDPTPTVDFLNAAAPLGDLMKGIEMYVSLLLTTNNLSTQGISMQLGSSMSLPSGVSLIIDKSESQEDVVDQQQVFLDREPDVWRKINKWIQAIKSDGQRQIDPDLAEFELPDGFEEELQIKFGDPTPIVSEGEHLDNLKKRQDLGINTLIELIKIDRPTMTDKQAEEKLKEILEEKLKRANEMMGQMIDEENGNANPQGSEDNLNEDEAEDDEPPRLEE